MFPSANTFAARKVEIRGAEGRCVVGKAFLCLSVLLLCFLFYFIFFRLVFAFAFLNKKLVPFTPASDQMQNKNKRCY